MPFGVGLLVAAVIPPVGSRLHVDQACYAIVSPPAGGEEVIGATWQSIRRATRDGRSIWQIVVHQRLKNGRFDLRDAFVLDAQTLRPISLSSARNGKPHAELAYGPDRVVGFKTDRQGNRLPIDESLTTPVWEGNLFGPTFAALPLTRGARFSLLFYQYDHGFGTFTVTVKGSEAVSTANGKVEAWVLDAGPNDTERLDYLISKRTGRELGYRSPEGGQRLGGDCAGLS